MTQVICSLINIHPHIKIYVKNYIKAYLLKFFKASEMLSFFQLSTHKFFFLKLIGITSVFIEYFAMH